MVPIKVMKIGWLVAVNSFHYFGFHVPFSSHQKLLFGIFEADPD